MKRTHGPTAAPGGPRAAVRGQRTPLSQPADTVDGPVTPGQEPPDVIEVVFPVGRPGRPLRLVATTRPHGPQGSPRRPARARSAPPLLRERPLLLGALAIAAVGLAAAVAWQMWPQPPHGSATDRFGRTPTAAPFEHLPGGLAASAPARSAAPRTTDARRRPARVRTGAPPASAGSAVAGHRPSAGVHAVVEPTAAVSAAPSASASAGPTGPRTLRAGDTGPDVTALQRLLFQQGLTYVARTGVYDDATVRGVTQVQHDRGLTCDPPGVYGSCTRAALTS